MAFRYGSNKSTGDEKFWSAYADLFLTLSTIFLLLYVVASLRQGVSSVQTNIEYKRMAHQIEDLKEQIRVYNTLKEDYLENAASQDDQQTYKDLMAKLDLLKDEAREEKEDLRRQATENEKKEAALNKYQQIIRNIINSNLVAQARIKRRDVIIERKDESIQAKSREIRELEKSVAEKKDIIAKSERTIASVNEKLSGKIQELRDAYERQEITKKKLDAETARLKDESEKKVAALREKTEQIQAELKSTNRQLAGVSTELESTKSSLTAAEAEKQKLAGELQGAAGKYRAQMDALKGEYEAQRGKDRADFEKALNAEKLSGAARAAREAEFKAAAERKARELGDKMAALGAKIKETEGELDKARALANARRSLAAQIKKNFGRAGIKADVDDETGDVVLDFGDHYFDTGRAELKAEMKKIVEKAMPVYSESLFGDKKIAEKITSVEIVGFASPTYKGKYIDPETLDPRDRKAVDFNLDLSYQRARSIFQHVFDTRKMEFKHQQQLLPLVKVTGRSFLAEAKKLRKAASAGKRDEFCEAHDCKKAQRVIIRFTLE